MPYPSAVASTNPDSVSARIAVPSPLAAALGARRTCTSFKCTLEQDLNDVQVGSIVNGMPRDTLTRDQIVRAAIDLLDAEGLEGLNMRSLGKHLGSAATAVYWHVGSKDDLIALAADRAWHEIALPDLDTTGWRTAATQMATGL